MAKLIPAGVCQFRVRLLRARTLMALSVIALLGSGYVRAAGPTVLSTEPASQARDVFTGANILVNFDRPMDAKSLTGESILVNGKPLAAIKESAVVLPDQEGKQAVILMSMVLDSVYEITLTTKIKDQQGNRLEQPFAWKFSTASHADDPQMPVKAFARFPALNAYEVPTNAPVTAVFITPLDLLTVTPDTFIVRHNVTNEPVAGTLTVKMNRVVFRPTDGLQPNTTYEVEIAAGIMSTTGMVKQRSSIWQFTTGDGPAEGPIVTDTWSEVYSDRTQRRVILHAAVENLVKPGKTDKRAIAERAVLATGHTLKAAIVPLKDIMTVPELSPITLDSANINQSDVQATVEGPTTTVVAAYTHGGGKGIGNNIGNTEDPQRQTIRSAAKAAFEKGAISALQDSGDVIAHGDQVPGDNMYSARLTLDDTVPGGPALATFTIVLPDGSQTEPTTLSLYIQPPWQESEDSAQ